MIDAVVVCYHADSERLEQVVDAVRHQVTHIWLVDNSANHDGSAPQGNNVTLLSQPKNIGVGAAQNVGISAAFKRGATRVLLLDQDSVMDANSVAELSRTLDEHSDIAAVGSHYRMGSRAVPSVFVKNGWFRFGRVAVKDIAKGDACEVDFMISSGSLIEKNAVREIGLMNERYFIDHVDTEWCLRARAAGYRLLGAPRAGMSHSLGERFSEISLGRKRFIPYHRPFRYYYIFRNSLWLYRAPFVPKKFISADVVRLMSILLICIIATKERREGLKMVWRGLKDGFRNTHDWAPIEAID